MSPAERRTRPWVRPALAGAAVALLAVLVGMAVPDALAVALVVGGLVAVAGTGGAGQEHLWPAEDDGTAEGSRRELTALTWTFTARDGRVSEAAVRRLREDAVRRLARRGVVLPDGRLTGGPAGQDETVQEQRAQARELLGERAWRTLTSPGGWLPSIADIAHCVDVVERLGDTTPNPATGPTTAAGPTVPHDGPRR